jgi:type IV pilus assembly protein PilP
MRLGGLVAVVAVCATLGLEGQTPPAPSNDAARASSPAEPPASPETPDPSAPQTASYGYSYNPEGRRDPFLSLIGRGSASSAPETRQGGLAGTLISEVHLKGILQDRGLPLAMVQAADGKTYLVKAQDRLMDGSVKEIMGDAVIFAQEVNDPLSLVKQRDVRKPLRPLEEAR